MDSIRVGLIVPVIVAAALISTLCMGLKQCSEGDNIAFGSHVFIGVEADNGLKESLR
ncbi:MAG: hypothetical protein LBI04_08230 [Treponema sp.]|jgi:hypothetical protein|nr:hypothetical protein [Treponema sp.]